jgi:hypothetical protein
MAGMTIKNPKGPNHEKMPSGIQVMTKGAAAPLLPNNGMNMKL